MTRKIDVFERIRSIAGPLAVGALLVGAQAIGAAPATAGGLHSFSSDRMVAHMASRLSLTDAQSQQVKQVFDARQAQMATQFQAVGSARQALREASLTSPVNEGAIRNAAQALAQAEGDAALLRAQVHAQIASLLTPDQQQKFAALRANPHRRWQNRAPAPAE
ncbi:MAG: Spy/CpxP family protein refolding chaperone [Thermoanaerobaculia bacterium]